LRKLKSSLAVVLAVAALTAGCQTNPVQVTEESVAARDARLAALKPWRASGSIAVDSKEQGVVNATFSWNVNNNGFDIRLIGPLGLKTFRVVEDQQGAVLTGDGEEFFGTSAELLLLDALGVRIPLVNMQDWVVGLQGNADTATRDRRGRIRKMRVINADDTHWNVNFESYASVDDLDLPRRIAVSGEGMEIKLSINDWSQPRTPDTNRLQIPTAELN
jgi:outer membrane lipoprotein LolB